MTKNPKALGEELWKTKVEKVNSELFTLTYGSLVSQLMKDFDSYARVNEQLEKMGYSMGTRMIEEFLAKSAVGRCKDFTETAEIIAKVGFKLFLGVTPIITNWSQDGKEFSLILEENPLTDFVELPEDALGELWYSNVICGVLKGALEMVQMEIDANFVSDVLRGGEVTEIKVRLVRMLEEEVPPGED